MFAKSSYTFIEDDGTGIIEVLLSGPVLDDVEIIVIGGIYKTNSY